MSPERRRILPLAVVGLGVLVALFFALTARPAPRIPRDPEHVGVPLPQGCLKCHGAGGPNPRPANHPISEACLNCHRWQE